MGLISQFGVVWAFFWKDIDTDNLQKIKKKNHIVDLYIPFAQIANENSLYTDRKLEWYGHGLLHIWSSADKKYILYMVPILKPNYRNDLPLISCCLFKLYIWSGDNTIKTDNSIRLVVQTKHKGSPIIFSIFSKI